MKPETYIFVRQSKIDELERQLNSLINKPVAVNKVSDCPLVWAVLSMIIGIICLFVISDFQSLLVAYLISVTVAQSAIDVYSGKNKGRYSAALRILALALACMKLFLT